MGPSSTIIPGVIARAISFLTIYRSEKKPHVQRYVGWWQGFYVILAKAGIQRLSDQFLLDASHNQLYNYAAGERSGQFRRY